MRAIGRDLEVGERDGVIVRERTRVEEYAAGTVEVIADHQHALLVEAAAVQEEIPAAAPARQHVRVATLQRRAEALELTARPHPRLERLAPRQRRQVGP